MLTPAARIAREYPFSVRQVARVLELVDGDETDARALLDAACHIDIGPVLWQLARRREEAHERLAAGSPDPRQ